MKKPKKKISAGGSAKRGAAAGRPGDLLNRLVLTPPTRKKPVSEVVRTEQVRRDQINPGVQTSIVEPS
jgi:hypothetical protein